jgi:hypothetical protein
VREESRLRRNIQHPTLNYAVNFNIEGWVLSVETFETNKWQNQNFSRKTAR